MADTYKKMLEVYRMEKQAVDGYTYNIGFIDSLSSFVKADFKKTRDEASEK